MQLPQPLGGADIDAVFLAEAARLIAGDEAEQPDMLVQLGELEFGLLAFVQVVEAEAREIGDENVTRQVAFLEAGKVVERLLRRAVQILATRLVLDEQHAFPEQVDETARAVALVHRLFE